MSFCTFSFGHWVVCSSSIYGLWLPLWYLQTLLYLEIDSEDQICSTCHKHFLSFPHSWLITWFVTKVTWQVPLLEQKLLTLLGQGMSWPWTYGSWINYLCNQCLSPLMLWVWISIRGWGVQHYVIKFVSDLRQVGGFLWVLRFLHQYNWNIVESCVKHHQTNKETLLGHLRSSSVFSGVHVVLFSFLCSVL